MNNVEKTVDVSARMILHSYGFTKHQISAFSKNREDVIYENYFAN